MSIGPIAMHSTPESSDAGSALAQELLAKKDKLENTLPVEILLTYEYQLRDVIGVSPHKLSSVPEEHEIVAPSTEAEETRYGPWQKLKH